MQRDSALALNSYGGDRNKDGVLKVSQVGSAPQGHSQMATRKQDKSICVFTATANGQRGGEYVVSDKRNSSMKAGPVNRPSKSPLPSKKSMSGVNHHHANTHK